MLRGVRGALARWRREPRLLARLVVALLMAADLVVAAVLFKPWAGTAEDLDRQAAALRQQVRERQAALDRLRGLVGKIEGARGDGDGFLREHFLDRRTASSTVVAELLNISQKAGIKQKEASFQFEEVEGSDTLSMMTVTANYEGTFADLMQFLNLLDGSERLLILDSLQAAPQQSGLVLNTGMKLHAFVREEAGAGQ
jgi:type IV pilus assembly protein PilO